VRDDLIYTAAFLEDLKELIMEDKKVCENCKWYIPEVCTRFPVWTDVTFPSSHYCGEFELKDSK